MAKKDLTPLKKGKAQFTIIGKVKLNDYTFNLDKEYDTGWTSNTMNLGIDCGNGNVVYAEMSSGYFPAKFNRDNKIYVHGIMEENGKNIDDYNDKFTIDWADRKNKDVLETVGKGCFITVGVEKDDKGNTFYQNFLAAYDAVQYLSEHLADDTVVNVKGNISYQTDGEKVYIKKNITNIALSKAEPENYKAVFTQTILLDEGSIGKLDEEKNTIGISAYVVDYIGSTKIDGKKIEVKKNFAIPVNMEFAVGENTELASKQLAKFFKAKKNEIVEITVEGNLVEGGSIVNITVDDIPDDIKELISIGFYTEKEALSKCAVGNTNREKRMVVTKPAITYVGEGDERKPTIARDGKKYTPDDIVFFGTYLATLDDATTDDANNSTNITDEDEDLLALLNDFDEI